MQEVWKDIEGYEGLYQVSNFGRVKSLVYVTRCSQVKREKVLKTAINRGYVYVTLHKDSKQKTVYVHRLVANAFIQNDTGKRCVNHINGNKQDNIVSNLEWCTHSENTVHAWDTGLQNRERKKNNLKSMGVAQYSLDFQLIEVFPSMREAERRTGIHSAAISRSTKTNFKAGGYFWKCTDNIEREAAE